MPVQLGAGWSWVGALVGACVSLGALLIVVRLPVNRRPDLIARVEPYVSDAPRPSRLLSGDKGSEPTLRRLVEPALRELARIVGRILGGSDSVRRRLQRAGRAPDVESFRVQQVLSAAFSAVGITAVASAWWWQGGGGLEQMVVLVAIAAAVGVIVPDQLLSRAVRRREERILQEFPVIAELLALSVTAGEGAAAALERVTRLSRGDLSTELQTCLVEARAGANLAEALAGLGQRTGVPSLVRFTDGIVVALERGTPLADVLSAQAQDAREAGRQALIEEGGRREIAMMVPVVFLVLPVTVLFAVYPGFSMLRISL